jgi:hypothetical protein
LTVAQEQRALTDEQRNFAACRVLGHAWQHLGPSGEIEFGSIGFVSTCSHCGTTRTKWIPRSGGTVKARYRYPKGYATHGDDRLSPVQWRRVLIVSL